MTKEGLIEVVMKVANCETKKQAQIATDAVFAVITKSLSRGEEVTVTGFGTFRTAKAAARTGRNPKTGETLQIPASVRPKFRAGKALKEAVK
ncbi:MAG: HU family DNA-binding protein [Candidatus Harrisonbacteria bacterium]|nr:HU family DNA-binding protein [Candidatus Harrisonbacteria bacterium]